MKRGGYVIPLHEGRMPSSWLYDQYAARKTWQVVCKLDKKDPFNDRIFIPNYSYSWYIGDVNLISAEEAIEI